MTPFDERIAIAMRATDDWRKSLWSAAKARKTPLQNEEHEAQFNGLGDWLQSADARSRLGARYDDVLRKHQAVKDAAQTVHDQISGGAQGEAFVSLERGAFSESLRSLKHTLVSAKTPRPL